MRRGELWLADLHPRSGAELHGSWPTTLDRGKLTRRLGALPSEVMSAVEAGMKASSGCGRSDAAAGGSEW